MGDDTQTVSGEKIRVTIYGVSVGNGEVFDAVMMGELWGRCGAGELAKLS